MYNQIAGKNLVLPLFEHWWVIPFFLAFALVIGVIAGFYPAFFLSSFKPVTVLKGDKVPTSRRSNLRTYLVVLQFSISTILIIATLTVHRQLSFIQNKNLGFSKDQVVVIHKVDDLGSRLDAFKSELLTHHDVLNASNSMDLLGNQIEVAAVIPEGETDNETNLICYMIVDPDFLDTYGIKIKSGRFFEEGRLADRKQMVLNETVCPKHGIG